MNNLINIMLTTLLNFGASTMDTAINNSEAKEYSVTQVIEHREIFLVQSGREKYLCRAMTPCFGLYKGEQVLFSKNPEWYNGQKVYYMDNSECRVDSCERVF
jgi:hypothetical protein